MNNPKLIPIERKEGVTLYGRVINKSGKLGQFEVYSDKHGTSGPYVLLSEAQKRFNALAKPVASTNFSPNENHHSTQT